MACDSMKTPHPYGRIPPELAVAFSVAAFLLMIGLEQSLPLNFSSLAQCVSVLVFASRANAFSS